MFNTKATKMNKTWFLPSGGLQSGEGDQTYIQIVIPQLVRYRTYCTISLISSKGPVIPPKND